MSGNILRQLYEYAKQEDIVSAEYKIMETATKLIVNEIKLFRTNSSINPLSDSIRSVFEIITCRPGILKGFL